MSAFLAGLSGTLGVVVAFLLLMLLGMAIGLVMLILERWQPSREVAFYHLPHALRQWITLEEGGFHHAAIKRDLRGPYILAPVDWAGHEARFRMRQRVERHDAYDVAMMRNVIIFRKVKK